MELPTIFADALKLPAGGSELGYHTPRTAKIRHHEAKIVRMGGTALTNATSRVPVIATYGLNPCVAIILYNETNKTGILLHSDMPHGDQFKTLLNKVSNDANDQVDVHIIGRPIHTKEDGFCTVAGYNAGTIDELVNILHAIEESKKVYSNIHLKTFDVWDKIKPHAVAIDTRNGNLIRGSKLFKTVELAGETMGINSRTLFDSWDCGIEIGEDFDGTVPEMQKQKRR